MEFMNISEAVYSKEHWKELPSASITSQFGDKHKMLSPAATNNHVIASDESMAETVK